MEGVDKKCTNGTKRPRDIIFENLITTAKYDLCLGNEVIKKDIDLSKIGKSIYLSIYLSSVYHPSVSI